MPLESQATERPANSGASPAFLSPQLIQLPATGDWPERDAQRIKKPRRNEVLESGRHDSNVRPSGPKPDALPG